VAELPLLRRFPALAQLPRASFGAYPTPIDRIVLGDGRTLLIKRDDRSGATVGGNKVRGLEWLLGAVQSDDRIVTVGARGSTHALLTAVYAKRLGARTTVVRWDQEMNPAAVVVDAQLRSAATVIDARFVPAAYAIATASRLRGARWIPAGGASPVAVLGHVNAALELADQIARDECAVPERIVVPLGTGGTAAGLALGLRIAGLDIHLVAVRVVPRIVGRIGRVLKLADKTASLIARVSGEPVPRVSRANVSVDHAFYGGAYGRPIAGTRGGRDEDHLDSLAIRLDDTYSRKAFASAVAQRSHRSLLWLTFDGRLLQD